MCKLIPNSGLPLSGGKTTKNGDEKRRSNSKLGQAVNVAYSTKNRNTKHASGRVCANRGPYSTYFSPKKKKKTKVEEKRRG